jgi:DNA-binding CsgD family transcriptional regulator
MRSLPMDRGVAVEEVAALTRVARAASDALAPVARAEQVLAELRGLVPFVCAQLTCWDPIERRHVTLASHGYADPVLEHLSGPAFESELEQLDMRRTRRPMRMRDLPGDPGDVRTVAEVLLPAGFREGLTMCLVTRAGVYAGVLNLSTDDRRHPRDGAREAIAALNETLANVVDATQSCRTLASLLDPGTPALALGPDGTLVELAGSGRGVALAEGSPLLAALAGQLPRDGHERRFLWPDGDNGWYRVRIVPCLDEAGGRSLALVTARPCSDVLGLTRREIEVLTLLARGASNPAIARELHVSPRTIATHVEHILEKLGVSTRTAAAGRAVREALVLPGIASAKIGVRDQGVALM